MLTPSFPTHPLQTLRQGLFLQLLNGAEQRLPQPSPRAVLVNIPSLPLSLLQNQKTKQNQHRLPAQSPPRRPQRGGGAQPLCSGEGSQGHRAGTETPGGRSRDWGDWGGDSLVSVAGAGSQSVAPAFRRKLCSCSHVCLLQPPHPPHPASSSSPLAHAQPSLSWLFSASQPFWSLICPYSHLTVNTTGAGLAWASWAALSGRPSLASPCIWRRQREDVWKKAGQELRDALNLGSAEKPGRAEHPASPQPASPWPLSQQPSTSQLLCPPCSAARGSEARSAVASLLRGAGTISPRPHI